MEWQPDSACPRCKAVGTNDHEYGGNELCYHCGECGYAECEHEDDSETPLPAPPQEYRPTTRELSGTVPDIAHSRNCQCSECAPTQEDRE